jgi:hypothetical protein
MWKKAARCNIPQTVGGTEVNIRTVDSQANFEATNCHAKSKSANLSTMMLGVTDVRAALETSVDTKLCPVNDYADSFHKICSTPPPIRVT